MKECHLPKSECCWLCGWCCSTLRLKMTWIFSVVLGCSALFGRWCCSLAVLLASFSNFLSLLRLISATSSSLRNISSSFGSAWSSFSIGWSSDFTVSGIGFITRSFPMVPCCSSKRQKVLESQLVCQHDGKRWSARLSAVNLPRARISLTYQLHFAFWIVIQENGCHIFLVVITWSHCSVLHWESVRV